MSVLSTYNLDFNDDIFTYHDGEKVYHKNVKHNISNDFFGYFFHFFKDTEDVEGIIADIDFIITDGYYNDEYCRDIFLDKLKVFYTNTTVRFETNQRTLIQEIPLTDFKQILLLWNNFLQTYPLNGSSV